MIAIDNDVLRVRFDRFDADAYKLFLRVKALPESNLICHHDDLTYTVEAPARFARLLGIEAPAPPWGDLPFNPLLLDDQLHITRTALDEKRYAVWSECGSGKTLVGLEYARHVVHRTGGRVLVVTRCEIVAQWLSEATKFYGASLPIRRLDSRKEMLQWCEHGDGEFSIAVTNYEKFNPDGDLQVFSEIRFLAGLILDESSRLRTGGGKQKWCLIKSSKGVEYKLSLTATPAPNEVMEFASQTSFLEKMRSENEIIWTFFRRDEKTHRWTVRSHARSAFFRFLAQWSIYLRHPKRYGWRLDLPDLPEPEQIVHEIPITPQQRAAWLEASTEPTGQRLLWAQRDTNAIQRLKLSQIAKGFVYRRDPTVTKSKKGKGTRVKLHEGDFSRIPSLKPAFVADLVGRERTAGAQVLVWTEFDAEVLILSEQLTERGIPHAVLTGKTPKKQRERIIEDFRAGKIGTLLTRASMLGFGMNLQFVTSMIFSGFSDSFERWYQAIRRSLRFGQTARLRIHVPLVPELEGESWANLCRKEAEFEAGIAEMEDNYLAARREAMAA